MTTTSDLSHFQAGTVATDPGPLQELPRCELIERVVGLSQLVEQLREALVTRAPIEQAKGILMATRHVSCDAAFDLLRRESQRTNRKLNAVAEDFVATLSTQRTGPEASSTRAAAAGARRGG